MIIKNIVVMTLLASSLPLFSKTPKRAVVIGASSGMGREVAKLLSKEGYILGLVSRRTNLLESLQKELHGPSYIKQIDVSDSCARTHLQELIAEMGGLDLIIISISSYLDKLGVPRDWEKKELSLDIDFKGFIAMADVALEFFKNQNSGHLVGISSTSGLRGVGYNPEYSAAKAGISYYMEAQRNCMIQNNNNVFVTDICPGYVAVEHSPMGQDPSAYWEITTEAAGKVILKAIKQKKKLAYVPERVWIIAFLLKNLPDCLYNRYLSWI